jgi:hypothetical protein
MWASSPRLTEFASADAKKMPFVFPGGVYVGKNFARLARLRAEQQPLNKVVPPLCCILFTLKYLHFCTYALQYNVETKLCP